MQPPGARVNTLCRRKERDRDHILNECAEREKCDGKCAPDSKKCHPHRFSRIVAQISCPWGNSGVSPGKIARRENARVANACFAFLSNPRLALWFSKSQSMGIWSSRAFFEPKITADASQ